MSPYVYERLLASPCVAAGRRLQLRAFATRELDQTPAWVSVRWLGSGPWGRHPGPTPRRLAALGGPPTLGGPSFPHGCPRGLRSLPERPELRPLLCWSLELGSSSHLFTRPTPEDVLACMSPGSGGPPLEWLLGPFTAVDGRQRDDIAVRDGSGAAALALEGPRRHAARSLAAPPPPPSAVSPRRPAASPRREPPCSPPTPAPSGLELAPSGQELDPFRSAVFAVAAEPGLPSVGDRHRVRFVGTAPGRRAAPAGRDAGGRGNMEQHLANVYSALQHELPDFLRKKHDYSLYSPNIVFLIEFLRLKTRGVVMYQLSVSLLHMLSSLLLVHARVEVLSLTRHDASASVQARWRLRGMPLYLFLLRFHRRDKSPLYRYYEAHSTFFVGPDGLIHCHKLDKLMPVNPTEHKAATGLGVLGVLGLREERPALSFAFPLLAPLARAADAASSTPAPPCAGVGHS